MALTGRGGDFPHWWSSDTKEILYGFMGLVFQLLSFWYGTYCASSLVYECYTAINSSGKRGCGSFLLCHILLFLKALAIAVIMKGQFYKLNIQTKWITYSQHSWPSADSNAHFIPPRSKIKLKPFFSFLGWAYVHQDFLSYPVRRDWALEASFILGHLFQRKWAQGLYLFLR